jgi:hypothetical protein
MTPPFLCLLAAACIFRYLSSDAMKQFKVRLAHLLPRNVMKEHLQVLMAEFPERLAEFRRRVLPYSAWHVALNAASAICFVCALWYFPPQGMARWDLIFVRYGSVVLTPLAFLGDAILFAKMLIATSGRSAAADEAV